MTLDFAQGVSLYGLVEAHRQHVRRLTGRTLDWQEALIQLDRARDVEIGFEPAPFCACESCRALQAQADADLAEMLEHEAAECAGEALDWPTPGTAEAAEFGAVI